jgi:uncharacterized repeat protein (TIGR03803 family)
MKTQRPISLRHLVPWLIFILVLAAPAVAQKVPATAREAASLPQFAPRLAHNGTLPHRASAPAHGPSCSPLPRGHGSRKALPQDGVIYDNGPYNGTTDAWTINFGFSTSDSFTGGANVTGVHFVYWDASASDLLTSLDLAVGSTSFGGTFQTSTSVINTFLGTNQYGYNLYQADAGFAGASGGPGYITLANACTTSGCSVSNPIYWDENSGVGCTSQGCPSTAYESNLGSIPSEAFSLTGGGNGCMPEQSGNFRVIHDFGGQDDGGSPYGVAINQAGELFGPTQFGNGTVFRLLKAGSDWVFSTLYNFAGGDRGASPEGLIIGLNGILYGDAYGGVPNCESGDYCGLIFGVRPAPTACLTGSCSWSENVPYSFTGPTDAWQGHGLVSDKAGNLYGVSQSGGAQQQGAVFELAPSSGGWMESILYSFTGGSDGGGPTSILVGNDGNLYGMAAVGGAHGGGVVFQLTPSGNGWTETVLYDLPYMSWGWGTNPHSLIQDSAGNLFGTYDYGGCCDSAVGLIFMLSPSDGNWVFTELHHGNQDLDGDDVYANMVFDAAGNLWGTGGGIIGCINPDSVGYIFELARTSDGWQYSTPMYWDGTIFDTGGALATDAQGNLYGTTSSCGSHQHGTVWELKAAQ